MNNYSKLAALKDKLISLNDNKNFVNITLLIGDVYKGGSGDSSCLNNSCQNSGCTASAPNTGCTNDTCGGPIVNSTCTNGNCNMDGGMSNNSCQNF